MNLGEQTPIKDPVRVQRQVRSKIEIISSDDEPVVMDRHDRFMSNLLSYGANIKSVYISTAAAMDTAMIEKCKMK